MSYMKIIKVVNKLGYLNIKFMWHRHLKIYFKCGLRILNNDIDVLKFREKISDYE